MKNPIIILGANSTGKAALDIFLQNDLLIYCFLDEEEELHNTEIFDIAVMGSPNDDGFLKYIGKKCDAFVAAATAKERQKWVELLKKRRKVAPVNAIHPHHQISARASVGEGNLIQAGVFVGADSRVGNHCTLQPNTVISSDCELGDYVDIGANASLAERISVGEHVVIGSNAVIMPGVKIGSYAQVAPGSLVVENVEDEQTVFGSPAKVVA